MVRTPSEYYSADQIRKNEMGGARGACWVRAEVFKGFWRGNVKERTTWKTSA